MNFKTLALITLLASFAQASETFQRSLGFLNAQLRKEISGTSNNSRPCVLSVSSTLDEDFQRIDQATFNRTITEDKPVFRIACNDQPLLFLESTLSPSRERTTQGITSSVFETTDPYGTQRTYVLRTAADGRILELQYRSFVPGEGRNLWLLSRSENIKF